MKIFKNLVLLIIPVILLFFPGCLSLFFGSNVDFNSFEDNPAYREKLLGLWRLDTWESGKYNTLEFKNDGTCSVVWYNDNKVSQTWTAKYKVSDFQVVFSFVQTDDVRKANYVINENNTLSLVNWTSGSANETYNKIGIVQNEVVLTAMESALRKATNTLISSFQKETIIAIVSISSQDNEMSEFIAGELETILVNNSFIVVDRSQLDKIRQEQNFQLGVDVDDNSAVSIGKFAGANIVITGTISGSGNMRRLRLRALDAQTARVVGAASEALPDESVSQQSNSKVTSHIGTDSKQVSAERTLYKIGDRGPAGGIIFYDKGTFSDGWRYLEAAPVSTEFTAQWENHSYQNLWTGQGSEVGRGKPNTRNLLSNNTAGQLCKELNYNGFNDWFLPSIGELELMYYNLKRVDLGDFSNKMYWSSSVVEKGYRIYYLNFSNGRQNYGEQTIPLMVRAARSF